MANLNKSAHATLMLNPEKGSGWLPTFHVLSEGNLTVREVSAWKNASAGKRWIKAKVQEHTTRKSVKLNPINFDANEKPISFQGDLTFKA